jgi:hypothetical protein
MIFSHYSFLFVCVKVTGQLAGKQILSLSYLECLSFYAFSISSDCTSLIYRVLRMCIVLELTWHVELITHFLSHCPYSSSWCALIYVRCNLVCLGLQPGAVYCDRFFVVMLSRQMLGLNFSLL